MILSKMQITKALISLHGCAGWSRPLLFTNPEETFSHTEAHINLPLQTLQPANSYVSSHNVAVIFDEPMPGNHMHNTADFGFICCPDFWSAVLFNTPPPLLKKIKRVNIKY